MSVLEYKLVRVDYDGNDTQDLGFFRSFPDEGVLTGELAAWLLSPGTGLPSAQAVVNGSFPYAEGDPGIHDDGFVPGFGFSLPAFVLTPDFNGDGKTDQIFGKETVGGFEIATWFMDGTGVIGQQFILDPLGNNAVVDATQGWTNPLLYADIGGRGPLGDFNGDSTTDILFLRESPPVMSLAANSIIGPTETEIAFWLIENGTAVTQTVLSETIGAGWSLANTNDFNGDGTTDLLFVENAVLTNGLEVESQTKNSPSTNIGVWTINGTEVLEQAVVGTADPGWVVVDTNDFDGNGTADIAFFNGITGEVGVWTMNGTEVTGQAVVGTVEGNWDLVDHNDVNGDGKADLIFKESIMSGDRFAVWLLDGTNAPLSQAVLQVGGSEALAGENWKYVGSGDATGDAKADLAFYNTSTGEVGGWTLDGSNVLSQAILGTVEGDFLPPFVQDLSVMVV
jgi:hypothetical protein